MTDVSGVVQWYMLNTQLQTCVCTALYKATYVLCHVVLFPPLLPSALQLSLVSVHVCKSQVHMASTGPALLPFPRPPPLPLPLPGALRLSLVSVHMCRSQTHIALLGKLLPDCALLPPPFPPPLLHSPLGAPPYFCVCAGARLIWHPVGGHCHKAGLWRLDAHPHGCSVPHPPRRLVLH